MVLDEPIGAPLRDVAVHVVKPPVVVLEQPHTGNRAQLVVEGERILVEALLAQDMRQLALTCLVKNVGELDAPLGVGTPDVGLRRARARSTTFRCPVVPTWPMPTCR